MVAELSVERMNGDENRLTRRVKDRLEVFTVHIDKTRIITVYAQTDSVLEKWVSEVQKANRNNKQPLILGVCVDREHNYGKKGLIDDPYDMITICAGNTCLIYALPGYHHYSWRHRGTEKTVEPAPKVLRDFLGDPNTIVVGMDLKHVSKKLEKDHKIEMSRAVGLRELGVKVLGGLAMKNVSDQNGMNMKLLDKQKDVVKMEDVDRWSDPADMYRGWYARYHGYGINRNYAMYVTVDAFFAREIGVKYLDAITELYPSKKEKLNKLVKA